MDLLKLLMNFKLSRCQAPGLESLIVVLVGAEPGQRGLAARCLAGGQLIYCPGLREAMTSYSICSTCFFPKRTN